MNNPLIIESYRFGRMRISGEIYNRDLIIRSNRVICPWQRLKGHLLQVADLEPYFEEDKPHILIVGTGKFGVMKVHETVRKWCGGNGIKLITCKTVEAADKFNMFQKQEQVAGAFHINC